jgi:pyruvate/2-oxoglutarate dehydrogenase complex dihydrolipoamide acyltransferase (E2) component
MNLFIIIIYSNDRMNKVGSYHIKPFSIYRRNIALITKEGWRKNRFHTLIEIDVTNARNLIKVYKEKTGQKISFTGWIVKCAAKTLFEHKELNAYRKGKKIYYFDDVDIPIPVERKINDEMVPMAYIIRDVNNKTLLEITKEIQSVQKQIPDGNKQVLGDEFSFLEKFAFHAPMCLKKFLLIILRRSPTLKKKHMGTLGVTSVGMKGTIPGWIIPMGGTTTMLFVIGSIIKKPMVVNDSIQIREILHVTITVDHDLIDGGPLARFTQRLLDLCSEGFSIPTP